VVVMIRNSDYFCYWVTLMPSFQDDELVLCHAHKEEHATCHHTAASKQQTCQISKWHVAAESQWLYFCCCSALTDCWADDASWCSHSQLSIYASSAADSTAAAAAATAASTAAAAPTMTHLTAGPAAGYCGLTFLLLLLPASAAAAAALAASSTCRFLSMPDMAPQSSDSWSTTTAGKDTAARATVATCLELNLSSRRLCPG
jgi:hypothetical protein